MEKKTRTKGNVIVEDIKIGDIHYEYDLGVGIKSQVLTLPILDENGNYTWKSKNLTSGLIIDYLVNPDYPHYSVNLYDFEAYNVKIYI